MKIKKYIPITVLTIALTMSISSATAAPKPLKVYILAGQSNMQGKAGVRTIERLNMTEDSKQMYMDMNVKNGLPSAPKDVYGVYFGGDHMSRKKASPLSVMKGPLRPGYEGEMTSKSTFGPEYTFGIYMQKHLNEPILIVKIAWGGRNLIEQFRPPSAGKYLTLTGKVIGEEKVMDGHGNPIGHYYNTVIKRVNEVLADPNTIRPTKRLMATRLRASSGFKGSMIWSVPTHIRIPSRERKAERTTPNTAVCWDYSSRTSGRT